MKHYNITVSGKVQEVFYRQTALEIAKKLGVKGFVQNETNGNVYIETEGTSEQLQKFVEWCKKGPVKAIVWDVKVEETEIKNYSSFEIRK
jgi:acylphosphatase